MGREFKGQYGTYTAIDGLLVLSTTPFTIEAYFSCATTQSTMRQTVLSAVVDFNVQHGLRYSIRADVVTHSIGNAKAFVFKVDSAALATWLINNLVTGVSQGEMSPLLEVPCQMSITANEKGRAIRFLAKGEGGESRRSSLPSNQHSSSETPILDSGARRQGQSVTFTTERCTPQQVTRHHTRSYMDLDHISLISASSEEGAGSRSARVANSAVLSGLEAFATTLNNLRNGQAQSFQLVLTQTRRGDAIADMYRAEFRLEGLQRDLRDIKRDLNAAICTPRNQRQPDQMRQYESHISDLREQRQEVENAIAQAAFRRRNAVCRRHHFGP